MYETKERNLSVIIVLIVVGLVGAWFVFSKNKIVSPVPEESNSNSRRVIFISPRATPTNEPTATPSATLKPTKKITKNTPKPAKKQKPTKKITATPIATASPTTQE